LPLHAFLNLGQDRCRISQWLVDQSVALIHRMVIVLIEVSNFGTRH